LGRRLTLHKGAFLFDQIIDNFKSAGFAIEHADPVFAGDDEGWHRTNTNAPGILLGSV
jgi:hypothetical protein